MKRGKLDLLCYLRKQNQTPHTCTNQQQPQRGSVVPDRLDWVKMAVGLSDGRTDSFYPSSRNLFILGDFHCHHPIWDSKRYFRPCGVEVFNWIFSSDLLPLNDPDTPTLLHRSSGSRSSPDIGRNRIDQNNSPKCNYRCRGNS